MVETSTLNWLSGNQTEALGSNPADMDTTFDFRYRVIELEDLITSHNDALQPNPNYPQELQPRVRDRAASRTQIQTMAQNLNPRALLHDSGFIDTGPMIVGPDKVVESGNGRVLALRVAADDFPERLSMYRDALVKNADRYGFKVDAVSKFKNPVLVRERLTKVDRVKFAADANVGAVMGMSPFEQALQDATRLSDNVVANLEVGEDQSIEQALRARSNDNVIRHFVQGVSASDRAVISEAKGGINQQGLDRLKLAIFAKTYTGDAGQRLLRIFGENVDPIIKNMENSMFQSLPDMAKAESLIGTGRRDPDLSIANDLAEVIDTFASLKQSGITVKDFLSQSALFDERLDPFQKRLLEHLDDISRKPKRVRELIRQVAERIVEAPPPGQGTLLGFETPTKRGIVNAIVKQQREEGNLPALSTPPGNAESTRLAKSDPGGIEGAGGLRTGMGEGLAETGIVPAPELAARTSVQTGLAGFGSEAAQVKMFAEFGGAPGSAGRADPLIDAEAIKAAELARPLPGQVALPVPETKVDKKAKDEKAARKLVSSKVIDGVRYELSDTETGGSFRAIDVDSGLTIGGITTGPKALILKKYNKTIRDATAISKPKPKRTIKAPPKPRPPRKLRKPRKVAKKPTRAELDRIEEGRSNQARALDESQLHSVVVRSTSPRVIRWKRDQGSMDIQGIDTPKKKTAKRGVKTTGKRRQSSRTVTRIK